MIKGANKDQLMSSAYTNILLIQYNLMLPRSLVGILKSLKYNSLYNTSHIFV